MSNGDELTPRRRQILDFISTTIEERGYPPTVREIGAEIGLKSSSSVHYHLRVLEEDGYITRDGSLTRALRVSGAGDGAERSGTTYLPLVGRVAAGEPILATENIERLVPTSNELFGQGELFLLEVQGSSMIEAGILDGDLVVVNQQPTAEEGEIVVAMLEDEATVKYLHRHSDSVELRPANSAMEPIFADDVQIIGRVRGVIRSLR
ncbi:MAG: transcriptional repressor LexA [Armatimonadota bacterium]